MCRSISPAVDACLFVRSCEGNYIKCSSSRYIDTHACNMHEGSTFRFKSYIVLHACVQLSGCYCALIA